MVARFFVGEDAAHQEGHVFTQGTYAVRMGRVIGIERMALVIGDLQDGSRRHAHPAIGEGRVGGGHVQERDLGRAKRYGGS